MKLCAAIALLGHIIMPFMGTASAQDAASNQIRTCTLLGCGPDNFAVSVHIADGSAPTMLPDVVVDVDGKVATCAGLVPDPTELYGARCGQNSNVRMSIEPDFACAPSGECTATGKNALRILVIGTPKKVRVSMVATPAEHATFEPKYEDHFPNGVNCPPPCRVARAVWNVSRAW